MFYCEMLCTASELQTSGERSNVGRIALATQLPAGLYRNTGHHGYHSRGIACELTLCCVNDDCIVLQEENVGMAGLQVSLESNRAHLQKQLRQKDADCNRMAVQIRVSILVYRDLDPDPKVYCCCCNY